MSLFIKQKIAEKTILGIWKKEETIEFLEKNVVLSKDEKTLFAKIRNNNRRKEWLTVRMLLKTLTKQQYIISYNQQGKPEIKDLSGKISISHSKNYVAIIISTMFEPGIDIEMVSDRVVKIKNKFLSIDELKWCNTIEKMTICWCAKEAIFKTIGGSLNFKDITILYFDYSGSFHNFKASINKTELNEFNMQFKKIEDNFLVFTLSPIHKIH